jgi:5-formyltetrahydrofolate cyclo-ligase
MLDKSNLRKHFSKLRSNITPHEQKKAAELAADNFLSKITPTIKYNDIISAYHPIGDEISPLPILGDLYKRGFATALPLIPNKNSPLIFRAWCDGNELCEHPVFKIKEPHANALELLPTIMIVPLLAFDLSGHRLGYGGGFFDRTIDKLKQQGHELTTIGLAYSCLQTDSLPIDKHDHQLDYVVTDKEVFKF